MSSIAEIPALVPPNEEVPAPAPQSNEDTARAEPIVADLPLPPPKARFPERAAWLRERLKKRGWNKHDLKRYGGPEHRTTQKILDELSVGDDVLGKVADALSLSKNLNYARAEFRARLI